MNHKLIAWLQSKHIEKQTRLRNLRPESQEQWDDLQDDLALVPIDALHTVIGDLHLNVLTTIEALIRDGLLLPFRLIETDRFADTPHERRKVTRCYRVLKTVHDVEIAEIGSKSESGVPKETREAAGQADAASGDRTKKAEAADEIVNDEQIGEVVAMLKGLMPGVICTLGMNNITSARVRLMAAAIAQRSKGNLKNRTPLKEALSALQHKPFELIDKPGQGYFLNERGIAVYERLKKSGQSRR